ncbi:MAG: PQQ-binding-like beta-propeller repeat protein [Marmoricola sp.]
MTVRPVQRVCWAALVTAVVVTTGVARADVPRPGRAGSVVQQSAADGARAAAPTASDGYALLIADNMSKRVLITDFEGNIIWQWKNPTGLSSAYAGPIAVRWVRAGRILATFGTGEVGELDVATKTWAWKTKGFGGTYFHSPYDAQYLPDGNLAVLTKYDEGGRVAVYRRSTGRLVWSVRVRSAHAMLYRSPKVSWGTGLPTIIVGGRGAIEEFSYRPGHTPKLVWRTATRLSHDLVAAGGSTLLSQDGTYLRRFRHTGPNLWREPMEGKARRLVVNPAQPRQLVLAGGSKNNIQFRRLSDGSLIRQWSRLSDGTRLDWPYGLRVIPMRQVLDVA